MNSHVVARKATCASVSFRPNDDEQCFPQKHFNQQDLNSCIFPFKNGSHSTQQRVESFHQSVKQSCASSSRGLPTNRTSLSPNTIPSGFRYEHCHTNGNKKDVVKRTQRRSCKFQHLQIAMSNNADVDRIDTVGSASSLGDPSACAFQQLTIILSLVRRQDFVRISRFRGPSFAYSTCYVRILCLLFFLLKFFLFSLPCCRSLSSLSSSGLYTPASSLSQHSIVVYF
jgi:hypothetical protein